MKLRMFRVCKFKFRYNTGINADPRKNQTVACLKYLSNFWNTLEIPLTNSFTIKLVT